MLKLSLEATALEDPSGILIHQLRQVLLDVLCQNYMLALAAVLILKHRAYSCQAVDQKNVLSSWLRTLARSAWHSTFSNSG